MKKQIFRIGLLFMASLCGLQLLGKPAKHEVMTVPTADGGELRVRLAGDEYFHQYFTEDGYPLIEKEGNFYYCDFDEDGQVLDSYIKAGDVSARDVTARSFLADVDMTTLEPRLKKRALRVARRNAWGSGAVIKGGSII